MLDIVLVGNLIRCGKFDAAKELSDEIQLAGPEKILIRDKENIKSVWDKHCFYRGLLILRDGDYQKGSELTEMWKSPWGMAQKRPNTPAPRYDPKKHTIKGKNLAIVLEGGYGDEIMFSRFANSFKLQGANKVFVVARPEIASIIKRISGIDNVLSAVQLPTIPHDYWLPGCSVGWLAGHTYDNMPGDPYLSIEPTSELIKSNKIKVGIRWAGNPYSEYVNQYHRRFPEKFMINLSKYSELQVYSFQRDVNLVSLPSNVVDLRNSLPNWEVTATAIASLDIMITSCTGIAHLSAAMGKETWIVIPIFPYDIWLYKAPTNNTSPFYKTVTLYRQKEYRKWNSIFQELYSKLETKFNLTHVEQPNLDHEMSRIMLEVGTRSDDIL